MKFNSVNQLRLALLKAVIGSDSCQNLADALAHECKVDGSCKLELVITRRAGWSSRIDAAALMPIVRLLGPPPEQDVSPEAERAAYHARMRAANKAREHKEQAEALRDRLIRLVGGA